MFMCTTTCMFSPSFVWFIHHNLPYALLLYLLLVLSAGNENSSSWSMLLSLSSRLGLMQVHVTVGHQLFVKEPEELKHCANSLHRNTLHCLLGLCWRWQAELGPLSGPSCWNVVQSSSQRLVFRNEAGRSAPCPPGLLLPTCAGTIACRGSCCLHGNSQDGLLLAQVLSEEVIVGS